jgi:hypothetical protein
MALLPRMLRPSAMIRRKAMYQGFLGPSTFWKVVGVFVFGKATIRKFFGKNVEVIDNASLGAGRFMQVTTTKPPSRRERRRRRRAGEVAPTIKETRVAAQAWADSHARNAS